MGLRIHRLLGALLSLSSSASAFFLTQPQHCLPASLVLTTTQSCSPSESRDFSSPISLSAITSPSILIDPAEIDPVLYIPWSFPPYCFHKEDLELCVFTNASFANGRGISIFTTPKIAKVFSKLPAFQDPTVLEGVNKAEQDGPGYVTSIPNKGMGVLAKRELERGELITAHTPLLLSYREEILSTSEREHFLRRAVDQLPEKSRNRYYDMAKIYNVESVKAQDVLKANTFGIQVGGLEHLSIWPEAARLNHECGPNSQYRISPSNLVHYVHAARVIRKDQEITVTYINPFHTYTQRQQALKSAFHFTCTCPRCTYSADSDLALHRIPKYEKLLVDWSPAHNARIATVQDAEQLVDLYKQEGLDGFLDVPYGHAALQYSASGRADGVVRYAKLAQEAVGLKEGKGVGDWNFWGRIAKNPKGHWSWGKRKQY